MITFESVSKRYNDGTLALDAFDLVLAADQTTAIVGPPRSGRSTVLRLINRLEDPTSGRVLIDGRDVSRLDPVRLRRGMGFVTADAGFFPHRTIGENLALVPRAMGWERAAIAARIIEVVEAVGLDPFVITRFGHELDRIDLRRAALAWAVVADPPVLLIDDPFSSLAPAERKVLYRTVADVQARHPRTVAMVTNDVDEAMAMADRVVVLAPGGRLAQEGTPVELLTVPIDDAAVAIVGQHRGLARLALIALADVRPTRSPVVTPEASGAEAIAAAATGDSPWVLVVGADDELLGWADTSRLSNGGRVTDTPLLAVEHTVGRRDTLLTALDQMVISPARMAVWSDGDGRLGGVITRSVLEPHLPVAGALG